MPRIFKGLTNLLRTFDLFPYGQLMRYNGADSYNTTTGGIISAAVLTIFVILFASMGLRTISKQIITSSLSVKNEVDPPALQFTIGPQGNFMFSLTVYGFNSTEVSKLLTISLFEETYTTGYNFQSERSFPLVPCTQDHFNFNSQMKQLYTALSMSDSLCPPLGETMTVQGKMSSKIFKTLRLIIKQCDQTSDPNCYNSTQFDAKQASMGQFYVDVGIIQSSINPSSQDYKKFYYQDQNYFTFTKNIGVSNTVKLQQDVIETDVSIMPYAQKQSQNIIRIPDIFTKLFFIPRAGRQLADIIFQKSSKTTTFERSFNKLDTYFSYVGGLVGTIFSLIFIMSYYTQKAYEVSLARKVFVDNDNKEISSTSFNIFYYFGLSFKSILNTLGCQPNWPKIQLFDDCCQETIGQLDVTYVIRKLMFLDAAMSKLFQQHQLQALYMRSKPTLEQAKQKRRMHFALQLMRQANKQEDDSQRPLESALSPDNILKADQLQFQGEEKDKYSENNDDIENVSGVELSHKEIDIDKLRTALTKVAQASKEGRSMSRKLIEDIDPTTLKKMGIIKPSQIQQEHHHNDLAVIESVTSQDFSEQFKVANTFVSYDFDKSKRNT